MTSAKGLGSGMPIGAIVARKSLMEQWKRGAHGNTYGGNPLSCAAAITTLDLVDSQYAANAARTGEHFMGRLRELARDYPCIGEVRGPGAMIALELVKGGRADAPDPDLTKALVVDCAKDGLILLSCGIRSNVIRFLVPLTASEELVGEGMDILGRNLVRLASG